MEEKVLIQPIISEKSFKEAKDNNVYTFKVVSGANKMQIAEAVKKLFNVNVENVATVNLRPRKVKFGKSRIPGLKSSWKKAMIKLAKGDKIEIFDIN